MTVQQPTPRDSLLSRVIGLVRRLQERLVGRRTLTLPTIEDRGYTPYRDNYLQRTNQLADDLVARRITVSQWRDAMATELDRAHTTAYAVGAGGVQHVDIDRVNTIVTTQTRYLDAWSRNLSDVDVIDAGQVKQRAGLYLSAVTSTLQRAATDRLGIPPLPAYPGDGSTQCLVRCKCRWVLEWTGGNDWNAYWSLGVAEHCPTCIARASYWSPVRIRGGVVTAYTGSAVSFRRRITIQSSG